MPHTNFSIDVIVEGEHDSHFYGHFLPMLFKASQKHEVLVSVATWRGQGGGWPTFTLSGERANIGQVLIECKYDDLLEVLAQE